MKGKIDPTKDLFQELASVDFNPDLISTGLNEAWCRGALVGMGIGVVSCVLADLISMGINKIIEKNRKED